MVVLVRLVLALLLATAALVLPASPARADEVGVTVTLTTSEIVDNGAGPVLHLAGTVTNTGTATLYTVQVLTWRDLTPITTRKALAVALAQSPTAATGSRTTVPGSFQRITGSPLPWAPGRSDSFDVTTKLSDLGLTATGVYLVGVHVRAALDQSAAYETVGRARTFVTVGTPASPAAVTSVVMLNSAPSYLQPGLLADDHLADELRGRLLTLVEHAHDPGVTYAIDPLLYREITTMAAGYDVGTPTARSPGKGQQAAKDWLAQFATLPPGYRLPYGSPDLALVSMTGDTKTLDRATAAARAVTDVANLPLLVAAPNLELDQRFLDTVSRLQPAVILGETFGSGQTLTSSAGTVVSVDAGAFAGGPGPDDRSSGLQLVARLKADSFLAAMDPDEGGVRVVTSEQQVALDRLSSPWEQRTPMAGLAEPSSAWSAAVAAGTPTAVRGPSLEAAVAQGAAQIAAYGSLADDTTMADTLSDQFLPAVLSTAWSSDDAARAWLATALSPYGIDTSGITLRVAEHVVMTSRDTQFPVTVANALPYSVKVRVVVTTSNEARLRVPASGYVTVDAGEQVTVNVSPKATANGSIDAVVSLQTEAGNTVGAPQQFVIEATETGKVGWVIVIISGLVLAAMTVLRIRQVARAPRRKEVR